MDDVVYVEILQGERCDWFHVLEIIFSCICFLSYFWIDFVRDERTSLI